MHLRWGLYLFVYDAGYTAICAGISVVIGNRSSTGFACVIVGYLESTIEVPYFSIVSYTLFPVL